MAIKGPFNVVFIGAGNINFGSDEGPWNHSVRLEHKLQTRLNVVAIIDPATHRSKQVKELKCATFVEKAYKDARLCKDLDEFVSVMTPEEKPHAIVIGSPAQFHGSNIPGQDLELQCLKHFPNVALFIEKPISCAPVPACYALADILEKKACVTSVGYMLRYLQVIQQMQRIIAESGKPVMMVVARYVCSYAKIKSEVWWNKSKSLGPIVEQGTHLVDLCRYFGGEAILDSVQATSTEYFEEAGKLEMIPIDESKIPEEHRIPRTTSALWKFDTGAVCSFTHALTLQGTKYSTELEVYLDGWQMKVVDLYNEPTLYVRSPEADAEQKIDFPSDDPYFGEISAWIDAAEGGNHSDSAIAEDDEEEIPNGILSSFRDACGTYALTWAIKEASERAMKTPATQS
ncbi:putative oxidoreductase C terminal-domain-containing protein [Melampsora americana]|nr:putative oxidoreductase C terminal-domain-containing protein [Melampsora americana]